MCHLTLSAADYLAVTNWPPAVMYLDVNPELVTKAGSIIFLFIIIVKAERIPLTLQ